MIENVLEKRDNENEFEHHKRLVYGKLKDKSLADYDYAELSEYVYGKSYSADDTRKRMYGSCKTLEMLDELGISNITEDDLLLEIKSKQIDLQKQKQQFFDQRREFNKLVNLEGRRDHLYAKLAEAAERLPMTVGNLYNLDEYEPLQFSANEAVLVLSDWHYGMVTDNVWNKYDVQTCKNRVEFVLDSVLDRLRVHKCRRVHVVLLGDLLHGAIHVSTRVAAEELVCDQLMQVSEIVAQFIIALSQSVEQVDVYSTFGNHARTVPKKDDNIYMDNMERIIPWWLEQRIAAASAKSEKPLNIEVRKESIYEFLSFDVCGYNFCATHGDLDDVRTASRSLPIVLNKAFGKDVDYIILADKHHQESFEEFGIESMIAGSLCGTDEYANKRRLYSEPFQLMLIVSPAFGVDARYKLQCSIF